MERMQNVICFVAEIVAYFSKVTDVSIRTQIKDKILNADFLGK